jgi:hypothetical protein
MSFFFTDDARVGRIASCDVTAMPRMEFFDYTRSDLTETMSVLRPIALLPLPWFS